MLDLQHQYNNCTTIPHMRVGPTYVRGCCAVVVLVLYKNQIPCFLVELRTYWFMTLWSKNNEIIISYDNLE
jgi:hypothetical protein